MNIALLIKKAGFSENGISQQGHYTKLALENCGYSVDIFCTEKVKDYENLENINIITKETDFTEYKLLLFVSSLIVTNNEEHINFLNKVKEQGCKIVNMICGNIFVLLQEEYIFNAHNHMQHSYCSLLDEVWVLPMYDFSVSFLNTYYKCPVKVIPYVWNPNILKLNNDIPLFNNNVPFNNEKVSLLIAEPNVSIHKNAFVPICIAEHYNHNNKDRLMNTYVLSGDVIKKSNSFKNFFEIFDIFKQNKIELYPRCNYFNILSQILNIKNSFPIVVSHQLLNDLNFIHFETLYLGWPLIHNCPRLKNVGYYYPEHDIEKGSELINYIRLNHFDNIENYKKEAYKFLNKYDPSFKKNIFTYKKIISSLIHT